MSAQIARSARLDGAAPSQTAIKCKNKRGAGTMSGSSMSKSWKVNSEEARAWHRTRSPRSAPCAIDGRHLRTRLSDSLPASLPTRRTDGRGMSPRVLAARRPPAVGFFCSRLGLRGHSFSWNCSSSLFLNRRCTNVKSLSADGSTRPLFSCARRLAAAK